MAIYFGLLFVVMGFISTVHTNSDDYCVASAVCQLVLGDIYASLDIKINTTALAINELNKYMEFKNCNISEINENCRDRMNRCEGQMGGVATSNGLAKNLTIDEHLLMECRPNSWFYMLFLCNTTRWPPTVKSLIPKDVTVCKSMCHLMEEFNKFHLDKGRKSEDFPPDWEQLLELTRNDTAGSPKLQNRQGDLNRKVYTYLEYDENAIGTRNLAFACPEGSWLGRKSDDLELFVGVVIEKRCVKRSEEGLLTAAQFRRKREAFAIKGQNIIVDWFQEGQYAYNIGEFKYYGVDDKLFIPKEFSGWGTPLQCPYRTAVCTVQITRYFIKGGKWVPTNVKLGCCDIPENMSPGITYVVVPYRKNDNPGFGSTEIFHARTGSKVKTPPGFFTMLDGVEKIHLCPPGQFVDKFRSQSVYTEELTDYLSGAFMRPKIVFLETDFFCNTRDKSFASRPLVVGPRLIKSKVWENLGTYECKDGFFNEARLLIDTFNKKVWERSMHCSSQASGAENYWTTATWDYPGFPTTQSYRINDFEGGEGIAKCPQGHAICGVGAIQYEGTSRAKGTLSLYTSVSVEGFKYRFLCCKVEVIERCNNPVLKIPRLTDKRSCPILHVNQATMCWVIHSRGTSFKQANTSTTSTSNSVENSFGVTAELKIKMVVGVGGSFSRSVANTAGYSWSTVDSSTIMNQDDLQVRYEIPAGSKLISAQPQLTCGSFLLYSNQTIDYVTPPIKCNHTDRYSPVNFRNAPAKWDGPFNLTVNGFGLELKGELLPAPELEVSWAELTEFVEKGFREDSKLLANQKTEFDWANADADVFEKFNPDYEAIATFNVPANSEPAFYRVIGDCGSWRIRTKEIIMLHEDIELDKGNLASKLKDPNTKPKAYFERNSRNGVFVRNSKFSISK